MKKNIHVDPVSFFFEKHMVPLINSDLGVQLIKEFVSELKSSVGGLDPGAVFYHLSPRNRACGKPFTRAELEEICKTPAKEAVKKVKKPGAEKFASPLFEGLK